MAIPFYDNVDLNKNEVQNPRMQNLGSAPSSPVTGQFYYDTGEGRAKVRHSGSWAAMSGLTAAEILALVLTVDGAASLLDADLLDGQEGTYYRSRTNHTGSQTASTISDFDTQVRTSRLDQMAAPTAAVSMNSQLITNLATATAAGHAVEYAQWMSALNGTKWKAPVRVLSITNLTLSGAQTIDGVSVIAGDRVAAFGQTTSTQDGIYLCAAGAWTRATDFPAAAAVSNAAFFVQEGTVYGDTQWNVTNNAGSDVVGTDNLVVAQIGAGTSYTADETTLHLTGTVFSIKTTYVGQASITTLGTVTTGTWNATVVGLVYGGLGVDASSTGGKRTARVNLNAPGKYTALIGDGSSTSIAITQATHGLATDSSNQVSVQDATTGQQVYCGVTVAPGTGTVTLAFTVAPASNALRVHIFG